MLILSLDGHVPVLSKRVDRRHGSEYKRASELLGLEETLGGHLLQPPAQSRANTEFRPGFEGFVQSAQPPLEVSP